MFLFKFKLRLLNFFSYLRMILTLRTFPLFNELKKDEFLIRSAVESDINNLIDIYLKLNKNKVSVRNEKLIRYYGGKLVLVVERVDGDKKKLIGFEFFYFNPRDFTESTIHEGFIGVLPEFEGKGIASAMRKHAIEHFQRSGINGISTRISKNNIASLRSAQKLGFRPIEEYYDSVMKEERYYLIRYFENNRD